MLAICPLAPLANSPLIERAGHVVEHALFPVEVHRSFEPPLHRLAAAQERAVDAHAAPLGAGDGQDAAVAQRQTMSRDETEALGIDVADEDGPFGGLRGVAEEFELPRDAVGPARGAPAVLPAVPPHLQGGKDELYLLRQRCRERRRLDRLGALFVRHQRHETSRETSPGGARARERRPPARLNYDLHVRRASPIEGQVSDTPCYGTQVL